MTSQNIDKLKKEALDPKHYNRKAKQLLFDYAVLHQIPELFEHFNQTPLMIAANLGLDELVKWLIAHGATRKLTDNWGRTPLQIALRQAYRYEFFARDHIGVIYADLAHSSIKVKIEGQMIKIDNKLMEFFY
jgi:predicted nucleic acid-binding protein